MRNSPEQIPTPGFSHAPLRRERTLIAAGWAFTAAVIFCLGAFPLRTSTDEWWHLKTGKWILENGIPEKDIFTYTAADYDWDNHEWLSQVAMYRVWRWGEDRVAGGWRTVILLKACLLVAAYLLLGWFMWQRAGGGMRGALIAMFLTLVAASVGKRMFWPRPPIISNVFFVFFLYMMWAHRSGRLKTRWLVILPLLMPLWANLHGGFLLGGIVVAAYFAAECLSWARGRWLERLPAEELRTQSQRLGIYLLLGGLCGFGSLLTPFGYKLYLLTGRVLANKDLVAKLGELQPPLLRFTWGYIFLFVFLGIGFILLSARMLSGKSQRLPPLAETLLVLFFAWQSMLHVRHLIFFGFAATPVAAWMLRECLQSRKMWHGILTAGTVLWGLWLVFLPYEMYGALSVWKKTGTFPWKPTAWDRCVRLVKGESEEPNTYPRKAAGFILSAKLPDRMYNRNNVCGYLIWSLSPERHQLFTDNRFDIFGGDFLGDEISIAEAVPSDGEMKHGTPVRNWREVVEGWGINWLFLFRTETLHRKLLEGLRSQKETGWALIYPRNHLDDDYAIWIKRTPENKPWIEKYEVSAEEFFRKRF